MSANRTALMREVYDATTALYDTSPVGCCLHILTSDEGIGDGGPEFCLEVATKEGHPTCMALAVLYGRLTVPERALVLGLHWCHLCGEYYGGKQRDHGVPCSSCPQELPACGHPICRDRAECGYPNIIGSNTP